MIDLQRDPSRACAYLRALLAQRKARSAAQLPALAMRRRGVRIDAQHVLRFRQLFGLAGAGPVPPCYAHVLAFPLQLHVLTHPLFPLQVLGTVHVRNPIEQHRALRIGEQVDISVHLAELRQLDNGLEHDIVTEVHDAGGELVWRGTSTNLLRARHGRAAPAPGLRAAEPSSSSTARPAATAVPDTPPWTRAWPLALAGDTGRRYAALSGDWNPIHLSAASARLFGFRRAIAHGMWTYAQVLALLEPHLPGEALRCEVQFRRPLLLPGRAVVRARVSAGDWIWVVEDARGQSLHASGTVRVAAAPAPTSVV